MSFLLTARVMATRFDSVKEKMVALILADKADESGWAWPSIKRISLDACLCESAVKYAIKNLVDKGLLERRLRCRPDGSHSSNVYRLRLPDVVLSDRDYDRDHPEAEAPILEFTGPGHDVSGSRHEVTYHGSPHDPLEPTTESTREKIPPYPPSKPKSPKPNAPPLAHMANFDAAWSAFPDSGRRRSSKKAAALAWTTIAKVHADGGARLLKAVIAYASSPDATDDNGKYVPGFHRWLKNDRWEAWENVKPRSNPHDWS